MTTILDRDPQFARTVFIFNPRSGGVGLKRHVIRLIDRIWGGTSRRYSILVTTRPGEGERLTRDEISRGAELLVAVGGDGTLNEIIRGALGSAACIGLIPSGSGNGFARHWDMPLRLELACRGLLHPRIIPCDVGLAGDHLFVVTFGCGIDALISESYARSTIRGLGSYYYHGAQALLKYRGQDVRVHMNGQIIYSGRPLLLTLANARGYGGGTIIAPQAQVNDGLLDLCALDSRPVRSSILQLRGLFDGNIARVPGYHHLQISEATIERAEKGAIHVDGDPYPGDREIRIQIQPNAFQFALPT